jgi:hypothetical protein
MYVGKVYDSCGVRFGIPLYHSELYTLTFCRLNSTESVDFYATSCSSLPPELYEAVVAEHRGSPTTVQLAGPLNPCSRGPLCDTQSASDLDLVESNNRYLSTDVSRAGAVGGAAAWRRGCESVWALAAVASRSAWGRRRIRRGRRALRARSGLRHRSAAWQSSQAVLPGASG